jgi:HD domain
MIGDYNWGLKTKGTLSFWYKLYFVYQAMQAKRNAKTSLVQSFSFDGTDFVIPDSSLANQTIEFLKDTHQDFLINHCYRTFLFGNVIGRNEEIKFDKELFFIASLLHDVGLTKQKQLKQPTCKCFAIEGAFEAGKFLEQQKLEDKKVKIIQDAIALHLNIKVPTSLPEAYLLNKGAGVDVIGRQLNSFHSAFLTKILEHYPRQSFKHQMDNLMKQQCKERPHSRISFLYKHGFSTLIKKAKFAE